MPRAEHHIARAQVSPNAIKVLERLAESGFQSHLVGGCVRDLMLGREPKDFDVVTDATPEQIQSLFRNTRLIGRRFRLAHVHFGREIVEVATFRGLPAEVGEGEAARGHETVYGSQAEDAMRRDFTVNALYYNFADESLIDYVGGLADLEAGVLRMIGDPEARFREDPVRMLRAIRFAAKLGFRVDEATAAPLRRLAPLLQTVSAARLFDEVLKLFHGGCALETYELLRHYDLFAALFPATEGSLNEEEHALPLLLPKALASTDTRINADKPVTPAFLFAALLWEPVRREAGRRRDNGASDLEALYAASEAVLREQLDVIAIPRRFSFPMREIWTLQPRFERRQGKQAARLLAQKRFRAAYDFLLLRAESGEADPALAQWWTDYQTADGTQRESLQTVVATSSAPGKRRRRRRRRAGGE